MITLDEMCHKDPFDVLEDPFDVLKGALDGELNHLPKAVPCDVIDRLRKDSKREDMVKLHLSLEDDDPKRKNAEEKEKVPPDHYAGDTRKMIDKWIAGSENKERFVQMRKDGHNLKEIIKLGICSKNIATKWKNELEEMLSS